MKLKLSASKLASTSMLALSMSWTMQGQEKPVDIEAQPLSKALMEFNEQTGVTVAASRDLVGEKWSASVSGSMEPEIALASLLEGSGLVPNRLPNGAYSVKPANQESTPDEEARLERSPFRMAQSNEQEVAMSINSQLVEDDTSALVQDVVIVEGIRGSLQSALTEKRETVNLTEVIRAEDIGKLPDQNIAEVLENVPGVQITRENGIGNQVSIRGSAQNRIEVNGRSTAPAQDARGGVELSDLPAEIVSSLNVTKTPTANMVEGSLGGTINIKTLRGLSLTAPLRTVRAEVERDTLAETWNRSYSGTFGNSFETSAGRIGVVATAVFKGQEVRSDSVQFNIRGETRFDIDGDSINDPFLDRSFGLIDRKQDSRESLSFNGSIEWEPSEQLNFYVDGSVVDFDRDVAEYRIINGRGGGGFVGVAPYLDEAVFRTIESPNGPVTIFDAGRMDGWQIRTGASTVGSRETLTTVFGLGGTFENEIFKLRGEVNGSKSESDTLDLSAIFQLQNTSNANFLTSGGARQRIDLFYDGRGDTIRLGPVDASADLSDPNSFALFTARDTDSGFENSNYAQRLDLEWKADSGILQSVETGVRFSQRSSERNRFPDSTPTFPGIGLASLSPNTTITADELFGSPTDYLTRVAVLDPEWLLNNPNEARQALGISTLAEPDPAQTFKVDEDTTALYALANLETKFGEMPFRANFGVRYVSTDQTSSGFTLSADGLTSSPSEVQSSYENWLPSASAVLGLTEEIQIRAGYAKILRRPDFSDLSPTVVFPLTDNPVRRGNPNLEPTTADQFDISAEYYFAEGSVASIGYFRKELNGVIGETTINDGIFNPLAVSGSTGQTGALVNLITPDNLEGGTITGLEFALQHSFVELPSPFDGLGIIANYTAQDGERDFDYSLPGFFPTGEGIPLSFQQLSEDAYNFTVFYEKYGFSGRLRYTWRSNFLRAEAPPSYDRAREQLNATLAYDINDKIAITFSGINLTAPVRTRSGFFEDGPITFIEETGRRFVLGGRVRF